MSRWWPWRRRRRRGGGGARLQRYDVAWVEGQNGRRGAHLGNIDTNYPSPLRKMLGHAHPVGRAGRHFWLIEEPKSWLSTQWNPSRRYSAGWTRNVIDWDWFSPTSARLSCLAKTYWLLPSEPLGWLVITLTQTPDRDLPFCSGLCALRRIHPSTPAALQADLFQPCNRFALSLEHISCCNQQAFFHEAVQHWYLRHHNVQTEAHRASAGKYVQLATSQCSDRGSQSISWQICAACRMCRLALWIALADSELEVKLMMAGLDILKDTQEKRHAVSLISGFKFCLNFV